MGKQSQLAKRKFTKKQLRKNKSAKNQFYKFVDLFVDRFAKLPIPNFYFC